MKRREEKRNTLQLPWRIAVKQNRCKILQILHIERENFRNISARKHSIKSQTARREFHPPIWNPNQRKPANNMRHQKQSFPYLLFDQLGEESLRLDGRDVPAVVPPQQDAPLDVEKKERRDGPRHGSAGQ